MSAEIEQRASSRPWSDFTQADYNPIQWQAACIIDKGVGDQMSKDRYALPVREPNGALNTNGLAAAAGRLDQVKGISEGQRATAARTLIKLYGQCNMEPPDSLRETAGEKSDGDSEDSEKDDSPDEERARVGEVEERAANIDSVDFAERIITVIAVPYESPAAIEHRGQAYTEVFSRSAFNGLRVDAPRARTIPVTAVLTAPAFTHQGGHLVGRVKSAEPNDPEGLRLELKISRGKEGDDTLNFAADRILFPSVGFAPGIRTGDTVTDRYTMTRRINRAFLDHLAFVPTPAYPGAKVLAVRAAPPPEPADGPISTPGVDSYYSDPVVRWAAERLRSRVR